VRDVNSVIQQKLQLENPPKRELSPISFLRELAEVYGV